MSSEFEDSSHVMTRDLLPRLANGDGDAFVAFYHRVCGQAERIAAGIIHRRGSPDGFRDADDLLNSLWAAVVADAGTLFSDIASTEDFLQHFARWILDRWILYRRRALARKRGGGHVIAASQLVPVSACSVEADDICEFGVPLRSESASQEVRHLVHAALESFPLASAEHQILHGMLDGKTHEAIGAELGLSRDAVGRKVRGTIRLALKRLSEAEDA